MISIKNNIALVVLTVVFYSTLSVHARGGRGGGGRGSGGGGNELRGIGGNRGGGHGGPGGPGKDADLFQNITCGGDIDFSCDASPKRGGEERDGVFVCRTKTNRFTMQNRTFPVCIPTDKALEDDECGCCEEECPTECDTCFCQLVGKDGTIKEGVEVLVADMDDPVCVPKFVSGKLVNRDDDVTCNTVCSSA